MRALSSLVLTIALAAAFHAGAQTPARPSAFSARVVSVLDGDSLGVLDGHRHVDVRLHGVDAPESGQAFSNVCTRTLANLVAGKTVAVRVVDIDRYGRSVARVAVDDQDVGLAMLRAGCAWHYWQYSNDRDYAAAELDARRARRGLWQDPNPTPPWERRRARGLRQQTAPPRSLLGSPLADTPRPALTASPVGSLHGNVKSRVFHAPGCQHFACASCTVVFSTREAAVSAGYRPHAACAGQ